NLLNQYAALTIATSDAYTRSFGAAGADVLTQLFADMVVNGNTLNAIWYGPWLVPLGYLIIRSGYFPKALGSLPTLACAASLAWLLPLPRPHRPGRDRLDPPGRRRHRGGGIRGVAGSQGRGMTRETGATATLTREHRHGKPMAR